VTLPWPHDLFATVKAQRQMASTGVPLSQAGFALRYYAPQSPRAAFFAALSGDIQGDGGGAPDQLLLGGDNGLRGYPLRYQSGVHRALLTVEQRYYTDWYLFRLARVGAAAFYDVGRAWGGVNQNAVNGGWLSDVGVGLRFSFDRAAFGNVLHVDLAVPLDRAGDIASVQLVVKSKATF
jgi:hemolysin activation/secretion protein